MATCGNHLKTLLASGKLIVVIRDYLFGKFVEQKVKIHNISLKYQLLQTNITILLQQVNITKLTSTPLLGHIRQTIARAGTHTDGIRKTYPPIHQIVQHATGKDTTHTSALKY